MKTEIHWSIRVPCATHRAPVGRACEPGGIVCGERLRRADEAMGPPDTNHISSPLAMALEERDLARRALEVATKALEDIAREWDIETHEPACDPHDVAVNSLAAIRKLTTLPERCSGVGAIAGFDDRDGLEGFQTCPGCPDCNQSTGEKP